jgi:hypothetical protein
MGTMARGTGSWAVLHLLHPQPYAIAQHSYLNISTTGYLNTTQLEHIYLGPFFVCVQAVPPPFEERN